MDYVNLTPHALRLNDGRELPASGQVARVQASFSEFDNDVCRQVFGEVQNLPEPQPGVRYVVSAMVLSALAGSRDDVVAPATGHPDCQRNEQGHVMSVPGFVQ
jgi:hypothetical protein